MPWPASPRWTGRGMSARLKGPAPEHVGSLSVVLLHLRLGMRPFHKMLVALEVDLDCCPLQQHYIAAPPRRPGIAASANQSVSGPIVKLGLMLRSASMPPFRRRRHKSEPSPVNHLKSMANTLHFIDAG